MKKKIEEAVDEIIKLYYSGASIGVAFDKAVQKLSTEEQYELIKMLRRVPKRKEHRNTLGQA